MKKNVFIAMIVVFVMLLMPTDIYGADAATEADACDSGDHIYMFVESSPAGYGALDYFNVDSCEYASYAHEHFCVTYDTEYTYECFICGYRKSVIVRARIPDMEEYCLENYP